MFECLVGVLESSSADETFGLGAALGRLLTGGDVVGLSGDLGAGKTRLAQGIASGLGIDPCYRVTSPTFTLVNEYPARVLLAHIDLYRLTDLEEMLEIGIAEYLGGEGVCVVEWVERCEQLLPPEYLRVRLAISGDSCRRLELLARGERHLQLARDWFGDAVASGGREATSRERTVK